MEKRILSPIKFPFIILSDIHLHNWSAFSNTSSGGMNSRLQIQLDAISEASLNLSGRGGIDIVITGDLYHTRGSIKPSVQNPCYALFKQLSEQGFRIHIIPGNHDAEFKDANWLGNAFQPLEAIENVTIYNEPVYGNSFAFIPYIHDKDELIEQINAIPNPETKTLFLHVGIDGVIDNLKGKIGRSVLERGFKYVFSGDYHNHVNLGAGIYSVGALTHHNWGDTQSTAGYLLVTEDQVEHYETSAPKFIDLLDLEDTSIVKGNYVRIKGMELTEQEVDEVRKFLLDQGALHVQDASTRPSITAKDTTKAVRVDLDMRSAVRTYCERMYGDRAANINARCERIMSV